MAVIRRNSIGQRAAAAVERTRRALAAARLSGRRGGSAPSGRVITAVEIALALLIGLVAGRIAIDLFAPPPIAKTPPPPPTRTAAQAATEIGNPFRIIAEPAGETAAAPADAADTTLDLVLHGTWVDAEGRGSAIIRLPDGEQDIFFVGETICCGARLDEVYPDRVIITRGGLREALRLAHKQTAAPADAPPPAKDSATPSGAGAAPVPMNIAGVARLQPTRGGDGALEMQLFPGEDEAQFERLGFRSGDVLVSINGAPVPKNLSELGAMLTRLEGAQGAELIVERGGERVPLKLAPPAGAGAVEQ